MKSHTDDIIRTARLTKRTDCFIWTNCGSIEVNIMRLAVVVKRLEQAAIVTFKPVASSVKGLCPLVKVGYTLTATKIEPESLANLDIVICRVHDRLQLRLVLNVGKRFCLVSSANKTYQVQIPTADILAKITEIKP